ncbi:hypothetical protein YPPY11_2104, partial [Yersinia pestis PY-11]
MFGNLDLLL